MKRLLLLAFMLLSMSISTWAQVKIALLEPRVSSSSAGVTDMEKAMIRGELRKAIVNHGGYEAFTRADIDQLMKEQDFQRTGMVSENDIKRLGEMSGADYICVSTLSKSNAEFYLEAYLINIETGSISNPASQYGELKNGKLANMLDVCKNLAVELISSTSSNIKKSESNNKESKTKETKAKEEETVGSVNSLKPLVRDGGRLYAGAEKLSKKRLKTMLSGEEYLSYRSGRRNRGWGTFLEIVGVSAAAGLVAFGIIQQSDYNYKVEDLKDCGATFVDDYNWYNLKTGSYGTVGQPISKTLYVCAAVSFLVFDITGIILKSVGKHKINNVAKDYNTRNSLIVKPTTVGFTDDMGREHLGAGLNLSLSF